MFVRSLCLLLCVGNILISAYPAPQDGQLDGSTDDPVVTDDPIPTTDDPILAKQESEGAESASDEEDSNSEDLSVKPVEDDKKSSTGESVPEESDSDVILEETITDQDSSVSESDPVQESSNEESDGQDEESSSESPNEGEEANSEVDSGESDVDNDESNADNPNTEDSNDDSHHFNDGHDLSSTMSNVFVDGRQLRVVTQDNGYEKLICQILLGYNDVVLDKECITLRPTLFLPRQQEFVSLDQKLIQGEKYFCQGISNPLEGVLQQLCVTRDGWIFNPVNQQENLIFY